MPARSSARERLLAAADELFYVHGIETTGVDAVVARAGVALGSLYKNFGGKDQLVTAYLDARDQRWRELWEACIAACTDPVDRVLAVFTALEKWVPSTADKGCAHMGALSQLDADGPAIATVAEHKRHMLDRLTGLVDEAGLTDPADRARDVMMIYEGVFGPRALGLDPTPEVRARRLAHRCLVDQGAVSRGRAAGVGPTLPRR